MSYVYNGNIVVPISSTFDIVGQLYKITFEEYTYWNSWRRNSEQYGCQKRIIDIYANTTTPHIAKMIADGYDVKDICREIFSVSYNYFDYAANGTNTDWIKYTCTDYEWVYDRVEMSYLTNDFISKGVLPKQVTVRNAY